MSTVIVFAGGDTPPPEVLDDLPEADMVVAADGGYDVALALEHPVDVLVGDLDSLTAAELPGHLIIERHPEDKDATDLELALELVERDHPNRVVVVGGTGGRADHELGTAALLCSPRWTAIEEIDWVSGRGRAHVIRTHRKLHGDIGTTLSLIPIGGAAIGVTTTGLHWNLDNATLDFGTTMGLSNRFSSPLASVTVAHGVLIAILPANASD